MVGRLASERWGTVHARAAEDDRDHFAGESASARLVPVARESRMTAAVPAESWCADAVLPRPAAVVLHSDDAAALVDSRAPHTPAASKYTKSISSR